MSIWASSFSSKSKLIKIFSFSYQSLGRYYFFYAIALILLHESKSVLKLEYQEKIIQKNLKKDNAKEVLV